MFGIDDDTGVIDFLAFIFVNGVCVGYGLCKFLKR